MPRSLTKAVGVQGIEVHPEAVTFSNSTEGKLYIHGRSDARHCLKKTRGRAIERVNRITLDHGLSGAHDTKNCKVQSSNHFRAAQQEPGCGVLDKAARRSDRIVLHSFLDDHAIGM